MLDKILRTPIDANEAERARSNFFLALGLSKPGILGLYAGEGATADDLWRALGSVTASRGGSFLGTFGGLSLSVFGCG